MWALNYIKCVNVGGSHHLTTMSLCTMDADGGANVLQNVLKTMCVHLNK